MKETLIYENYSSKEKKFIEESIILNNEPTINDFLTNSSLDKFFIPVANIVFSTNVCGYSVVVDDEFKNHRQWTYILVINGRVIKIGDTTVTLLDRWGSYSAGTKVARKDGTCSTTNYFISEVVRTALGMGYSVQLYGYPIPNQYIEQNVFGKKVSVLVDSVKYYETYAIDKFVDLYGKTPVVGKNGKSKK